MSGGGRSASVLVVAGEPSGEQHAAGLIDELKRRMEPVPLFFGSGGPAMAEAGVRLLHDVSGLAAIGPRAAFSNLRGYWNLYQRLRRLARTDPPSLAILVDFPDFNLRLAAALKAAGIPVCYFISPQIWAWRQSRVKQISRNVDLMLVIFPFEEGFYRARGVEAHYVGNPTAFRYRKRSPCVGALDEGRQTVALLPGSRRKEVELILPVQLDAVAYVRERRDIRAWLIRAGGIPLEVCEGVASRWADRRGGLPVSLEYPKGGAEELLSRADCAVVKSGTSTLEALLSGVPFAMTYRLSWASWALLRPLVRQQSYCLANLVAGRQVVPEFVQHRATGANIGRFLLSVLENPAEAERMRNELRRASLRLGDQDAYAEAADLIVRRLLN